MMNFIACIRHRILLGCDDVFSGYQTEKTSSYSVTGKTTNLTSIVKVIKSRRMRWAGHVARMGEGRGVYRVLVGRPEGKRPLRRPRRRWDDNIKLHLREVGIDGANWIRLAQDRVQWRAFVNMVMNLRVP
jgi:hypothetical protein